MNTKMNEMTGADSLKIYENNFIDLIRNRLGIIIHPHQSKDLRKTIAKACEHFSCSPSDYLKMLSECATDSPLFERLVIGVTIGETYFFRDKNQMCLLQEQLLPDLIKKKREQNNLNLRIWSAGCATGEEIFTMAMMLSELLPDLASWTVRLLGTDINTHSLQKAVRGRYKEWSMRSINAHYKKRYFTKINDEYHILPQLKELVTFFYLNLNDDNFPSIANGTNAQDLILCRNVLIYFDNQRINTLMKKLSMSLVEDGFLLLGASDPVVIQETSLHSHARQSLLFSRSPSAEKVIEAQASGTKIETISHLVVPMPFKKAPHKTPIPVRTKKLPVDEINIQQLLAEAKWKEIVDLPNLKPNESAFLLNAKATALANLGQLKQALSFCEKSLAVEGVNKNTHFLYAMVLLELNQIEAASTALRKTLFLDHTFVLAHFQLGLLFLRTKHFDAGVKCLKNALSLAKTQKPQEEVNGVADLRYGRLVEILEHEIELHASSRIGSHEAAK